MNTDYYGSTLNGKSGSLIQMKMNKQQQIEYGSGHANNATSCIQDDDFRERKKRHEEERRGTKFQNTKQMKMFPH